MVLGPINQVTAPCSSIPNPKNFLEYKRLLKEEEVTNVASHNGFFQERFFMLWVLMKLVPILLKKRYAMFLLVTIFKLKIYKVKGMMVLAI